MYSFFINETSHAPGVKGLEGEMLKIEIQKFVNGMVVAGWLFAWVIHWSATLIAQMTGVSFNTTYFMVRYYTTIMHTVKNSDETDKFGTWEYNNKTNPNILKNDNTTVLN